MFCLFIFFKYRVRAWAVELYRGRPFFHGSGFVQKGRLRAAPAPQHCPHDVLLLLLDLIFCDVN